MKRIDILYFEGCTNYEPAVALARSVAGELGIDAEINVIEIMGPDDARARRFLGSPSIQVNGVDVEPEARERSDFGFSCRTYAGKGLPNRDMLVAALRDDGCPSTGSAAVDSGSDCCGADSSPTTRVSRDVQGFGLSASAGSVVAAVAASACCWLPLMLVAFGFSAGSLGSIFETTRPYLLTVAAVLLSIGFYFAYVRKPKCETESACETASKKSLRLTRVMLWTSSAAVAAFAAFPYYIGIFQPDPVGAASLPAGVSAEIVDLKIDGMTCAGCATGVRNALIKLPGVLDARVDYDTGRASLVVDAERDVREPALIDAVTKAGYYAQPAAIGPAFRQQRTGDEE